MKTANDETSTVATTLSSVTGGRRRTLEAIFHHPSAHNLEWSDVVALIEKIGHAQEKANNEFVFEVAGKRHVMHKPHTKDLTGSEVVEVRRFLVQAGCSPEPASHGAAHPDPVKPSLLLALPARRAPRQMRPWPALRPPVSLRCPSRSGPAFQPPSLALRLRGRAELLLHSHSGCGSWLTV